MGFHRERGVKGRSSTRRLSATFWREKAEDKCRTRLARDSSVSGWNWALAELSSPLAAPLTLACLSSAQSVWVSDRGAGTIFFLGGGKHVDMPSDCQNLGGGHRHIHPLQTKSWGGGQLPPPCPPGSRAPGI